MAKRYTVWACFGVDAESSEQAEQIAYWIVNQEIGKPRRVRLYLEHRINTAVFVSPKMDKMFGPRKPTTVYYDAALKTIEALEQGEKEPDGAFIEETIELVKYGRRFEELVPDGVEEAQKHYDLLLERLEAFREGVYDEDKRPSYQ